MVFYFSLFIRAPQLVLLKSCTSVTKLLKPKKKAGKKDKVYIELGQISQAEGTIKRKSERQTPKKN